MEHSQLGIIFIEEWSLSYCGFFHETENSIASVTPTEDSNASVTPTEDSIASVTPTEVLQTTEGLGKWCR